MITNNIPGGNIKVVSSEGHRIELDVELRDTEGDWFYWCFKAVFPETGTYHFHFVPSCKVGPYGPAVSFDGGMSWQWLSAVYREENQAFDYDCSRAGEEVVFCMGMQYLQQNFDAFRDAFADHAAFRTGTLCRSRKGRDVELVAIREGAPEYTLLLTSRHHAGEMMATHALEGILRAVLADSEFGRDFRKHVAVYAVPFVDKDGVEDGDQGKNRIPHDHARDYQEPGIYPETIALRRLIGEIRPDFVLDMHCPWIRSGQTNEASYLIGIGIPRIDAAIDQFATLLEAERVPEAPYSKADNIPFGTSWNTAANYTKGQTIKHYAAGLPFVSNASTIEIPFANFRDVRIDRKSMLIYGGSIARALLRYLKEFVKK